MKEDNFNENCFVRIGVETGVFWLSYKLNFDKEKKKMTNLLKTMV